MSHLYNTQSINTCLKSPSANSLKFVFYTNEWKNIIYLVEKLSKKRNCDILLFNNVSTLFFVFFFCEITNFFIFKRKIKQASDLNDMRKDATGGEVTGELEHCSKERDA